MEESIESPVSISRRPRMLHVSKAPLFYTQMYGAEADKMFNVKGTYKNPCRKCKK